LSSELDSDVVIVLPNFPVEQNDAKSKTEELIPEEGDSFEMSIKFINESAYDYGAIADVESTSRLVALFNSADLPIPKMRSDSDETIKLLDNSNVNTFIIIGLFSNRMLMNKLNLINESTRLFKIDIFRKNGEVMQRIRLANQMNPEAYNDENLLQRSKSQKSTVKDFDYALIAKMKYNHKTIIILGGMGEIGTVGVGRWFRRNYQEIESWIDQSNQKQLQGNCFSAIIQVYDKKYNDNPQNFIHEKLVRVGAFQNFAP
jgi:hypothetical protein